MNKKYLRILLIALGTLLSAISFFLFASPFISLKLGTLSNDISGFELAFDFEGEYISTDFGQMIMFGSFIVTFASFAMAVTLSIMTIMLLSGKKLPKSKNAKVLTEEQQKKQGLISLISGIIVSFVPLIINLNVISICGYEDNQLANVGTGAIASGVLFMLAEFVLAFSNYYAGYKPLDVTLSEEEITKKSEEVTTVTQQLQELSSLKEQGLISEEDYESKKKQILGL